MLLSLHFRSFSVSLAFAVFGVLGTFLSFSAQALDLRIPTRPRIHTNVQQAGRWNTQTAQECLILLLAESQRQLPAEVHA